MVFLVRCAVMHEHHTMFPDDEVQSARRALEVPYGRALTIDEVATKFDPALVHSIAKQILAQRAAAVRAQEERMGVNSPCHLCGGERGPYAAYYDFGLARVLEDKTEWGAAGAALALNLLTLPLGFAVGAAPGHSTKAQIVRCRLVLCDACVRRRTRFFAGLVVSEADCQQHPSWAKIVEAGFTKFYTSRELDRFRRA